MSMCSKCQGKYNKFSALKGELSQAADQTSECKSLTNNAKSTFSSVVISGTGIDKDDTSNIIRYLSLLSDGLSKLILQCSNEMSNIKNGCPGPNHYKKKTRLNSENE